MKISFMQLATLIDQIKSRSMGRFIMFMVGAITVLAWYLLVPYIWSPYVRVPSDTLTLSLSCVPSDIKIDAGTPYLQVRQARLVLQDSSGQHPSAQYGLRVDQNQRSDGVDILLVLATDQQQEAIKKHYSYKDNVSVKAVIEFSRVPYFDLIAVDVIESMQLNNSKCAPYSYSGKELVNAVENVSPRLMRYILIQEKIGDFILGGNQLIGNILLATLTISVCWLIYQLGNGLLWFTYSDKKLIDSVNGLMERSPEALRTKGKHEVITSHYRQLERRLVFARVVGPAIGFLLTVSSLVAGLHPSVQGSKDQFLFISSLQIALIATFMGLLIRVAAEFVIRVHRNLAERKMLVVDGENKHD